jgi:hypothetical protein
MCGLWPPVMVECCQQHFICVCAAVTSWWQGSCLGVSFATVMAINL